MINFLGNRRYRCHRVVAARRSLRTGSRANQSRVKLRAPFAAREPHFGFLCEAARLPISMKIHRYRQPRDRRCRSAGICQIGEAAAGPACFPGSRSQPRPASDGVRGHRRSLATIRADQTARRTWPTHQGNLRSRGPPSCAAWPVPSSTLGRSEGARWDCTGHIGQSGASRARRADISPRRFGSGRRSQPTGQAEAKTWIVLPVREP
jgi:hypothetical protein